MNKTIKAFSSWPLHLSILDLVSPYHGNSSDDTERQSSSILRIYFLHFRLCMMSSAVWYLLLFKNVCVSLTSLVKPKSGLRKFFCASSNFLYTYLKSKLWNHIQVLPSMWRLFRLLIKLMNIIKPMTTFKQVSIIFRFSFRIYLQCTYN
jgi:hypothetical protein